MVARGEPHEGVSGHQWTGCGCPPPSPLATQAAGASQSWHAQEVGPRGRPHDRRQRVLNWRPIEQGATDRYSQNNNGVNHV